MACFLLYCLPLLLYCVHEACCASYGLLFAADIDVIYVVEVQDGQLPAGHVEVMSHPPQQQQQNSSRDKVRLLVDVECLYDRKAYNV